MSDDQDFEFKDTGFRALMEALANMEGKKARVGILGGRAQRSGKGHQNNAEIGMRHEFGIGVPMRSFLRVPIIDHMQAAIDKSGAFSEQAAKAVINQGSVQPWLEKLGVLAEAIVIEGFTNGGYGKWAPLSAKTMEKKKVQMILVETRQLSNSITSEVK